MTMMEMLKRQPRGMVSHNTLIEIAEEAGRKHVDTGEQVADLLINACRYGVIMGKRMERARRKRNRQ